MKKFNSFKLLGSVCAGVFLTTSPSWGQWPTFDPTKVINSIMEYNVAAQGYMEMANTTTSMTAMQQALGDNVGSMTTFTDEAEDAEKAKEKAEKMEKRRKRIEKMKKTLKQVKDGYNNAQDAIKTAQDYAEQGQTLYQQAQNGGFSDIAQMGADMAGVNSEVSGAAIGAASSVSQGGLSSVSPGSLSGMAQMGAGMAGINSDISGAAIGAASNVSQNGWNQNQNSVVGGELTVDDQDFDNAFSRDEWDGEMPVSEVDSATQPNLRRAFVQPTVETIDGESADISATPGIISDRMQSDIQSVSGPRNRLTGVATIAESVETIDGANSAAADTIGEVNSVSGSLRKPFSNAIANTQALTQEKSDVIGSAPRQAGGQATLSKNVSTITDTTKQTDGSRSIRTNTISKIQALSQGKSDVIGSAPRQAGGQATLSKKVSTIADTNKQTDGSRSIRTNTISKIQALSQGKSDVIGSAPRQAGGQATLSKNVSTITDTNKQTDGSRSIRTNAISNTPVARKAFTRPESTTTLQKGDTIKQNLKVQDAKALTVSDNSFSIHLETVGSFAQEAPTQSEEADGGFVTGTTEMGNFIYSDIIAQKCGLNYSDELNEESIRTCFNTWVKCLNVSNQTQKDACIAEYEEALSHHVASDLTKAIMHKNFAATFEEEVAKDQETKAQATTTERDEISFVGTIAQSNQDILIKLMEAQAAQLITNSWEKVRSMDTSYLEEEESGEE